MTQSAQTTTTTPTTTPQPTVQRKENGGAGGAMKSHVRGMSFAEGASALAPVQMHGGNPNTTTTNTTNTTNTTTNTTNTANANATPNPTTTTEEPALVDHGSHDVGQHDSMHGFLGAVANMPEQLLSGGKTVKLALEGQITTAYILKIGAKVEVELSKKADGSYETSAKLHFGLGVGFEAGAEDIAKVEFLAGLCGDYNLKGSGDSYRECWTLMKLAVETSMRQAAQAHIAETPAEAMQNKTSVLGKAWAWFKRAVLNTAENVRSWSLSAIINVIWGDAAGYEARKSAAANEMDANDGAEVEALVGVEAKLGVEAGGVGAEVEGANGVGTRTKLAKGDGGTMATTSEKGQKIKLGAQFKIPLGTVKAEIEEFEVEPGKSDGEAVIECKGGIVNWAAAGADGILGIINLVRTKCGSKALKTFGASVAADAAAIIHHTLHEHAEHAAHGAHEATEKIFESAIEAGFEFKFKGTNGTWKLEAIELINEVELGANMQVAKAKFTGVVKRSLYHAHEEEGGEHESNEGH